MDKETTIFILQAIEKLSRAILTDDYEPLEIHEINQQSSIILYDLEKEF
jgi:hypothetical protein